MQRSVLFFLLSTAAIGVPAQTSGVPAQTPALQIPADYTPGPVLLGHPYTGTAKTTTVQILADGTSVTQASSAFEARDSMGRTIFEIVAQPADGAASASTEMLLFDPATRTMTTWMTGETANEALVIHLPDPARGRASRQTVSDSTDPAGDAAARGDFAAPPPDMNALLMGSDGEALGMRTIGGLAARGSRTTSTVTDSQQATNPPVQRTAERWVSPELLIPLLEVDIDPLSGQRTTEMTNLQRIEPDPSLFQIPDGYTLKDVPSGDNAPPVLP